MVEPSEPKPETGITWRDLEIRACDVLIGHITREIESRLADVTEKASAGDQLWFAKHPDRRLRVRHRYPVRRPQ